ncbi:VanZ family protein [Streptomyces actinomycinicus]|uniref:VanZ family protein n=1 Tax=Streptomyces actinomycinicus TaxID=1695166 RepID=A0A937EEA5_9ACTN|nr:VanZ family protein [Streptomyces actinomycinicus]
MGGLAVVAAVLGAAAWWGARRRRAEHAFWWFPFVFCLTGVLGVTLALRTGEGGGAAECVVNHEIAEPFHTTQGLWNLAMFVPVGFFGVLALRRPVPVLAGVVALPCLIELAQALGRFVSGVCDSADVEMNVCGGLAGLAAGLLAVRGRVAWRAWARRTLVLAGALGVLGAGTLQTAVTLTHVDGSSVRDADGDERAVAERVVRQASGDRYRVRKVQISPGIDGYNGQMYIHLAGGGSADLMWPGGRRLDVDFEDASGPGLAVPGTAAPHDAEDAFRIARSYMRAHYPWAESASWHATRPAGEEQGGGGWTTSWRFKEHGVSMPRSLDVRIDRTGRVHGLLADFGPRHVALPAGLVSARQAEEIVRRQERNSGADVASLRYHARELTAERTKGYRGPWRAVWHVEVARPDCRPDADGDGCEPYDVEVDAATRRSAG